MERVVGFITVFFLPNQLAHHGVCFGNETNNVQTATEGWIRTVFVGINGSQKLGIGRFLKQNLVEECRRVGNAKVVQERRRRRLESLENEVMLASRVTNGVRHALWQVLLHKRDKQRDYGGRDRARWGGLWAWSIATSTTKNDSQP